MRESKHIFQEGKEDKQTEGRGEQMRRVGIGSSREGDCYLVLIREGIHVVCPHKVSLDKCTVHVPPCHQLSTGANFQSRIWCP